MPRHGRMILLSALLATVALTPACTGHLRVRFEATGAALTTAAADQLAQATDISAVSGVKASDAPALRAQVLADLRTHGPLGDRAADLLTAGFPARTLAVPVLVRASKVDGHDAILVVEAFGEAGGTLTHRRLWIFDVKSGGILGASSFR
jgi:hypothetical protein